MNFEQARFNMVEQQIRPWGVLDFNVLDALSELPRECFVSQTQQAYAYADMHLPLPNGSCMLEPKIVARLVQGLALDTQARVLEIGTGSGYATALLAKLAGSVVTIDSDRQQQLAAKTVLDKLGLTNIGYQTGDGLAFSDENMLFDAIYIGGAVTVIPEVLKKQLNQGGKMVAVAGMPPVQRALLLTRNGEDIAEQVLFDTCIPYLTGPSTPIESRFRF